MDPPQASAQSSWFDTARSATKMTGNFFWNVSNHIPGLGHLNAAKSYMENDTVTAGQIAKTATRATGVAAGGVTGMTVGGPPGAVAGGIGGGVAFDTAWSYYDRKPTGYVEAAQHVRDAANGTRKMTAKQGASYAALPVSDGLMGYFYGSLFASPSPSSNSLDSNVRTMTSDVGTNSSQPSFWNRLGLGKAALDNRANQLNPNHVKSGLGRSAGYPGLSTAADLNNHANQLNPNNAKYGLSRFFSFKD